MAFHPDPQSPLRGTALRANILVTVLGASKKSGFAFWSPSSTNPSSKNSSPQAEVTQARLSVTESCRYGKAT